MKKTTLYLLLVTVLISLLSACTAPVSNTAEPPASPSAALESATPSATEPPAEASSTPAPTETAPEASSTPSASQPDSDIAEQTKDFLMHGQEDKPEAGKLHWTQAFLDQVDINAVYEQYLADGGKAGDVTAFAEYLTENAPVPDNWKELFEADLLAQYGVKPSSYEDLGDDFYQVYIMNEGKEVPYVGLNARTGYYHG